MLFQKSNLSLIDDRLIKIIQADSSIALKGKFPRLIDEWQNVPNRWNLIRHEVDQNGELGDYILTGSATPIDSKEIHHSGAGRIATIKILPMSLQKLFDNQKYTFFDENKDYSLRDTAYLICRGGWPQSIVNDREFPWKSPKTITMGFSISNPEKMMNSGKKRPEFFRDVLKTYARNISSQAPYSTMINDLKNNHIQLDVKTFNSYIDIAKSLFIIEDIDAWSPNLRSKTAIRTTPTRHFVDTSIACQAMNISPNDLLNDANTFGLLFEDMAIRDLKIYADTMNGIVRHYRDKNDLEVDAIIHLDDGRWVAIEIKLGSEKRSERGRKKSFETRIADRWAK